jgi:hypothetical protein
MGIRMKRSFMFAILVIVLLCTGISGAAQKGGRWQLLGEQAVNFDNDPDRIDVKKNDGHSGNCESKSEMRRSRSARWW